MTDEADRHREAKLETAKLHLVSENESVVRHAMEEHEGLVASWVQEWRHSLFPTENSPAKNTVNMKKKRA